MIWDKHNCDAFHAVDAAHYRTAANSGMGKKPSDRWLFPACRTAHREQHTIGQKAFEERYGISLAAIATGLARQSPDPAIKAAAT